MKSKSALFLIELLISLMLFALSAALVVQMFAVAHSISDRSRLQTKAVVSASSVMETLQACGGDLEAVCEIYEGGRYSDDELIISFDEEWNCVAPDEAMYEVAVRLSGKPSPGEVREGTVEVMEAGSDEALCSLEVSVYNQLVKGGE
ncbi:MAG: type II secretion system GspH family protein [Eubacterium sp.]|nr:type II secretion system GspH family protein [Eubacterium sp.]